MSDTSGVGIPNLSVSISIPTTSLWVGEGTFCSVCMDVLKSRLPPFGILLALLAFLTISCSIPPLVEYTVVPADELELPPASSRPFSSTLFIVDNRASNLAHALNSRLKPLGLKNYEIKQEENEIRIIAMASPEQQEMIEKLITQKGYLTFREVHPENESLYRKAMEVSDTPPGFRISKNEGDLFYLPIDPGSSAVSTKEISVPDEAAPPHGYFFCLEKTVSPHNPEEEAYRLFCVSQHVGLDGSSIASAKALPSFYDKGRWEVDVMFNSRGGRTFSDLTKRCIGKKLAIVLDNVVIFAPVVHEEVNSPSCRITGNFTKVEGEGLTLALNSGPLPYTGEIVKKRFITGRK